MPDSTGIATIKEQKFMPPIWVNVIQTKHIVVAGPSMISHGGRTTLMRRRIQSKRKPLTLLAYTICQVTCQNGLSAVLILFST